jgi:hypothetical protein
VELRTDDLKERRASVDRLLAEMAAENERCSQWWEQPVEGWNRGRLTICGIVTSESTVIYLATKWRSA